MMRRKLRNAQLMNAARPAFLGYVGGRVCIRNFRQASYLCRRIFRLAGIFYFDWDLRRDVVTYSAGCPQGLYMALPRSGIRKYLELHKEDDGSILSVFRDVLENRCVASRNYEVVRENGEFLWYRVNTEVHYDNRRNVCRVLAVFTDITVLRKKQMELYARTQRDSLTNLYNKGSTEEMIAHCIAERKDELHALFFIDIDNFKELNDSLGHLRGDHLLEWLSGELRSLFRSQDILGRVGGDEFIAFCVNIREREDAARKAEEIIGRMQAVRVDSSNLYKLSVSVGVAIFDETGKSFFRLYEEADLALYEAKRCGKNQFAFYSEEMKGVSLKRADG